MNPLERFQHYKERITRLNPELNAFVHLRLDEAEAEAKASAERHAAGAQRSPIDGWCVGVKANIAVKGMPHHAGINAYRHDIAHQPAGVVKRLTEAGAIVLGITNMHEGALGATTDNVHFGRTINPWRRGFTPGGSSGGSAAAVSAELCDAALGSDTMGSVRIPSAYCGVQGFKPSLGAFASDGVLALSHTLDHVGVHAYRVSSLRAVTEILSLVPVRKEAAVSDVRFGVWQGTGKVRLAPEVAEGFAQALSRLPQASGHGLKEIEPPEYQYSRSRRAGLLISEVEASALHAARLKTDPEGFSVEFRKLMAWGAARPQDEIDAAYAHIRRISDSAASVFAACDFLLAPVTPETAFSFSDPPPAGQADFTAWANFAGLPAASVLTGISPGGLPLALQVIGPHGADAGVLAIGEVLENLYGQPPRPPLV